jgi:hypothetical protein
MGYPWAPDRRPLRPARRGGWRHYTTQTGILLADNVSANRVLIESTFSAPGECYSPPWTVEWDCVLVGCG